jgi:DNA-binding IclR family transcriptional regulator
MQLTSLELGRSVSPRSLHVASPPSGRVIAVINLLTSKPDHEFKLAEIVQELEISKATCHAIVRTLLDSGYLLRSPRSKAYVLGPALVAAGRAAERTFPSVRFASATVEYLSREYDAECVASIIEDQVITVVDRASPRPSRGRSWVGQCIPLMPPFGAVQVAFMEDAQIDHWVDRAPAHTDADALRRSLQAIRRRGFDVQSETESLVQFRQALAALDRDSMSDEMQDAVRRLASEFRRVEFVPDRLEDDGEYPVNAVSAPVFDSAGHPVLTLSAQLERSLTGHDIMRIGQHIRRAADEITAATGGLVPAPGAPSGTNSAAPAAVES